MAATPLQTSTGILKLPGKSLPRSPIRLSPQHLRSPPVVNAQVWYAPTEMAVILTRVDRGVTGVDVSVTPVGVDPVPVSDETGRTGAVAIGIQPTPLRISKKSKPILTIIHRVFMIASSEPDT